MKKLTAGIFAGILAIVTVNAARADIATTNYVNQNVDAKVGALSGLETSTKDNTVAAINEVNTAAKAASTAATTAETNAKTYADGLNTAMDARVTANKNAIDILNGEGVGSVKKQIEDKIKDTADAVTGLAGDVTDLQQDMDILKGDVDIVGSVDNKIKTAIDGLDGNVTGTGVVKTIKQENGVLTATLSAVAESDLDTALAGKINGKMNTTDYNTATTMAADGTYAKKSNTVGVNLTELDKGIVAAKAAADSASTAAGTALTDAKAYTDARETAITTAYKAYADTAEADAVATSKGYADELNTAMNARVTENTNSITTLNGADTVEGSVKKQIKDAIANVNTAANTLKGRVDANESAISTLNGTGDGSVKKQIETAINGVNAAANTLAGRVTANETAISTLTNNKANAADVYTKTEIDGKVSTINTEIGKKVTATNLQNKLLTTTAAGQLQDASTGLTKPTECGQGGVTCMLVNDGSGFKWEKIVDTYAAK